VGVLRDLIQEVAGRTDDVTAQGMNKIAMFIVYIYRKVGTTPILISDREPVQGETISKFIIEYILVNILDPIELAHGQ
jgi:hypothetical protein